MSVLKLTVIGCGDAFNSGGRLHSCFHVSSAKGNFLIDCGATTLLGLKREKISVGEIDAIVISHFHGDHYGGIPFLLMEAMVIKRTKLLTIVSPPGGEDRIRTLTELLYPGSDPLAQLNVVFLSYQADEILNLDFGRLTVFPMVHSAAACPHGLRFEIDHQMIAFTGDTGWTPQLIPLSESADLLICECNFYHTHTQNHLHYLLLKENLALLTAKQIYLTHLDTEMLNCMNLLQLPVLNDGDVIEL